MNHRSTTKNLAPPLFVMAVMFILFTNSSKAITISKPLTDTTKESIFAQVDVQPQFPGGLPAFGVFLGNTIQYPAEDAKNKVQGTAICKFVVERDGHISNVEVVRAPTEAMGKEAIRVLSASPKWKPGQVAGRLVRVSFTVPIHFSLNRP